LLPVSSKENKIFLKKDALQKLQKKLRNVAKENNIKVTLKMRKTEIIESILKTQVCFS
jgi:phage pi2 protein 07